MEFVYVCMYAATLYATVLCQFPVSRAACQWEVDGKAELWDMLTVLR